MPKLLICAECGSILNQKLLPHNQKIAIIIMPHNCEVKEYCEFYPLPMDETCVCFAGSDVSGKQLCTPEYSITCNAAIRKKGQIESNIKPSSKQKSILDREFEKFKFVKKLNDLKTKPNLLDKEVGDNRNKDHLRSELQTSTAPLSILQNIEYLQNSTPSNDISQEPEDDD
uniref:Uncharacterized protein n=1 Tax=viral metagenome TaxID=1070528 RepID=A0A6M3IS38_9ZZZZ